MTKPGRAIGQLHVRQRLRVINRVHIRDRLHLHDDNIFDNQIDSVVRVELNPLVYKRYRSLTHIAKVARAQLIQEARRVCGFEEAWTEAAMNFDGRTEDLVTLREPPLLRCSV